MIYSKSSEVLAIGDANLFFHMFLTTKLPASSDEHDCKSDEDETKKMLSSYLNVFYSDLRGSVKIYFWHDLTGWRKLYLPWFL